MVGLRRKSVDAQRSKDGLEYLRRILLPPDESRRLVSIVELMGSPGRCRGRTWVSWCRCPARVGNTWRGWLQWLLLLPLKPLFPRRCDLLGYLGVQE
jgi:hypothetical protein